MPARFEIDVTHRVVFSYAADRLTYTDLLRHQDRLVSDPRFSAEFAQIADFRDLDTGTEITTDEVRELAKHTIFSDKSRRAFVAPDETLFGLARVYASVRAATGESNVRVVKSVEDAAKWATVDASTVKAAFDRLRVRAHASHAEGSRANRSARSAKA